MDRRNFLKAICGGAAVASLSIKEKMRAALMPQPDKDLDYAKKEFEVAARTYDGEHLESIYMPHANLFDNHEIHLRQHRKWLMANYWKFLATDDKPCLLIAQATCAHTIEHGEFLCKQQGYKYGDCEIAVDDMVITRSMIKKA